MVQPLGKIVWQLFINISIHLIMYLTAMNSNPKYLLTRNKKNIVYKRKEKIQIDMYVLLCFWTYKYNIYFNT